MSHGVQYILIVDDEPVVRLGAATLFSDAGYGVFEAANAADAIRLLTQHPEIRLVFTDIDMPGSMDGIALAKYVSDRYPPIRIIVASGKAHAEHLDLPPGGLFVAKPYQDNAVLSAAAALIL